MNEALKQKTASYNNLAPGDPAPWFVTEGIAKPRVDIASHAGQYIVLGFFGTATDEHGRAALETVRQARQLFDGHRMKYFGISWTAADTGQGSLGDEDPGIRYMMDRDGSVGRLYGVLPLELPLDVQFLHARRRWFVLDPQLRVLGVFPFMPQGAEREPLLKFLSNLPPCDRFAGFEMPVPIMAVPFVFEPDLCRRLIQLYEEEGGTKTGIWRDVNGKTTRVLDDTFKRRSDISVKDPALLQAIKDRIARRLFPEIEKVHFIRCTRSERYIIGCYDSEDRGFFRPHRDNTAKGAKHRRFAASINLNADFDGGELNFPEYGSRWFKMPPGTAVIFSTPLMHQVSPVTRGRRYAFLPFLYDEEAAKIREQNREFVQSPEETS
jgi:predicted 2-oxoglutarate/Fe(II)-dependent dioxygenase YbiX/peroxiredoxin